MDVKTVAQLPRQLTQVAIDPGDVDGDGRMGDGAGVEEGRHQGQFVEFPAEVEPAAVLPHIPDVTQGQDVLAQPWGRCAPGHAKTALDVGLDLGAQAEDETPLAVAGQVPGYIGRVHGAAGKGHGDGRAQT
ncbi:MAG: hypothetical protein N2383_10085 [Caldilineales bacterium]|nr:hypothetical protein [Caldilineales bacterium]